MTDLIEVRDVPPCPPRPNDAHKGTFGTVIVVGGCPTMIGAPALCAAAALRSGAGLVKIATDSATMTAALIVEPSATGIVLGEVAAEALAAIDQADPDCNAVLALGPGMGTQRPAAELLIALLDGKRKVVLDADGLNLLAATGQPRPQQGGDLVMTPHPGEFARLAQSSGIVASATSPTERPIAAAAELAHHHRAVVVLKGRHSVVTDGRRFYINTTGNPALATAGSGDVLTGLIAALIGQHLSPFDAAVLGTYLHGLAADIFAQRIGPSGLTARHLADLLPEAFGEGTKEAT
jgi:ADP-dependent NAD(P)H-hydrate dehydratase